MTPATSQAYDGAVKTHNEALRIFEKVTRKYRAMEIGDDEFLAAKAVMNTADSAFDVAFAKEQRS